MKTVRQSEKIIKEAGYEPVIVHIKKGRRISLEKMGGKWMVRTSENAHEVGTFEKRMFLTRREALDAIAGIVETWKKTPPIVTCPHCNGSGTSRETTKE